MTTNTGFLALKQEQEVILDARSYDLAERWWRVSGGTSLASRTVEDWRSILGSMDKASLAELTAILEGLEQRFPEHRPLRRQRVLHQQDAPFTGFLALKQEAPLQAKDVFVWRGVTLPKRFYLVDDAWNNGRGLLGVRCTPADFRHYQEADSARARNAVNHAVKNWAHRVFYKAHAEAFHFIGGPSEPDFVADCSKEMNQEANSHHVNMAQIGPPAWAALHQWAQAFKAKVGDSCGCGDLAVAVTNAFHDAVNMQLGHRVRDLPNLQRVAEWFGQGSKMRQEAPFAALLKETEDSSLDYKVVDLPPSDEDDQIEREVRKLVSQAMAERDSE